MYKLNYSPLHCIHKGCGTIPTIVLEFKQPEGMKILLQIISCTEHSREGIETGYRRYPKSRHFEFSYPGWLQRLHNEVLQKGTQNGNAIALEDVKRLRSFRESNVRRPEERR